LTPSLLAAIAALPAEPLAQRYGNAQPFPHLVLDDLLPVAEALALEQACRQAPTPVDSSNGFTQAGKTTLNDWRRMPAPLLEACALFNSGPVLEWLESITGLQGLLPDPHLEGGGLHRTERGGFLKLHTDFNWNTRLQLYRRLNVLLYLNHDYQHSWGGELLLTRNPQAERLEQMTAIQPIFNRLVIFNTNDTTYHGHPTPHAFPEGYPRTSLAFYYYTAAPAPRQQRRRLRATTTRYRPALAESIELRRVPLRRRLGYWLRRWTPLG
jgi:hypothetical protein